VESSVPVEAPHPSLLFRSTQPPATTARRRERVAEWFRKRMVAAKRDHPALSYLPPLDVLSKWEQPFFARRQTSDIVAYQRRYPSSVSRIRQAQPSHLPLLQQAKLRSRGFDTRIELSWDLL